MTSSGCWPRCWRTRQGFASCIPGSVRWARDRCRRPPITRGVLDVARLQAKYAGSPDLGGSGHRHGDKRSPTTLRLFFLGRKVLPRDLRETLQEFVPEPPGVTVLASDDLPPVVRGPYAKSDEEGVEPRVRHTARAALHDVKAVLRLADNGELRVGDKTRRPSQAALKAVAGVLLDGDFYSETEQGKYDWDPASTCGFRRSAGRCSSRGRPGRGSGHTSATDGGGSQSHDATGPRGDPPDLEQVAEDDAGRRVQPDQRHQGTAGQRPGPDRCGPSPGRGRGRAPGVPHPEVDHHRGAVPLLKASDEELLVTHHEWKLYLIEQQYGSFGYNGRHTWETLQGRFVLAFLFESAATLGLLDVAYGPAARSQRLS